MAHISKEMWKAYEERTLSRQEELDMMEHIAQCDDCAGQFAKLITEEKLVSPPPDLKKDILVQTVYRRNPVQTIKEIQERKGEMQREFLAYTARVVFAMAASVFIVITMSFGAANKQKEIPAELIQIQQQVPKSEKKLISNSLQKASGRMGDVLEGFLAFFDKLDKEEGE